MRKRRLVHAYSYSLAGIFVDITLHRTYLYLGLSDGTFGRVPVRDPIVGLNDYDYVMFGIFI